MVTDMAHTIHDQKKLLLRVGRIRGQVNAVEKALLDEKDCSTVLVTLAACRGAINSLMSEVLEGHVRFHVLDPKGKPTIEQTSAAEELIDVIRTYLK
jgi:DNA-binding FrmR family transcriptional regulator